MEMDQMINYQVFNIILVPMIIIYLLNSIYIFVFQINLNDIRFFLIFFQFNPSASSFQIIYPIIITFTFIFLNNLFQLSLTLYKFNLYPSACSNHLTQTQNFRTNLNYFSYYILYYIHQIQFYINLTFVQMVLTAAIIAGFVKWGFLLSSGIPTLKLVASPFLQAIGVKDRQPTLQQSLIQVYKNGKPLYQSNLIKNIKISDLTQSKLGFLKQLSNENIQQDLKRLAQTKTGIAAITGFGFIATALSIKQIYQNIVYATNFGQNSMIVLDLPITDYQKWQQTKQFLVNVLLQQSGSITAWVPPQMGSNGQMFNIISLDRQQQSLLTLITPWNAKFKSLKNIPKNQQHYSKNWIKNLEKDVNTLQYISNIKYLQFHQKIQAPIKQTQLYRYYNDILLTLKNLQRLYTGLQNIPKQQINNIPKLVKDVQSQIQNILEQYPPLKKINSLQQLMAYYSKLFQSQYPDYTSIIRQMKQKYLKDKKIYSQAHDRQETQIISSLHQVFEDILSLRKPNYKKDLIHQNIQVVLNLNYFNKLIKSIGQPLIDTKATQLSQQILVPMIFKQLSQMKIQQKIFISQQSSIQALNKAFQQQSFFSKTISGLASWWMESKSSIQRINKAKSSQLSVQLSKLLYQSTHNLFQSVQGDVIFASIFSLKAYSLFAVISASIFGIIHVLKKYFTNNRDKLRQMYKNLGIKWSDKINSAEDMHAILQAMIPTFLQMGQIKRRIQNFNSKYMFQQQSVQRMHKLQMKMNDFVNQYQKIINQQLYAVNGKGQRLKLTFLNLPEKKLKMQDDPRNQSFNSLIQKSFRKKGNKSNKSIDSLQQSQQDFIKKKSIKHIKKSIKKQEDSLINSQQSWQNDNSIKKKTKPIKIQQNKRHKPILPQIKKSSVYFDQIDQPQLNKSVINNISRTKPFANKQKMSDISKNIDGSERQILDMFNQDSGQQSKRKRKKDVLTDKKQNKDKKIDFKQQMRKINKMKLSSKNFL